MRRDAAFVAKRGLAQAIHSVDPVFDAPPDYFDQRLEPSLRTLLDAAVDAGAVCTDVAADGLLSAVASLCISARNAETGRAERMVALLVDGMRYGP